VTLLERRNYPPLFVISEAGYQVNGLPGDSQRLGNYKVGRW